MTDQSGTVIRDDNLRLVLSKKEAAYIEDGLRDAKAGLIGFSIVAVGSIPAIFLIIYMLHALSLEPDTRLLIQRITAMLFFVATPFCIFKAVGAFFRMRRFRSFKRDHEKFLKHYRRQV